MTKTPISQVLARVSLCWPPMSVCGKNVDTLRACKRSNRDFFPYIYRNTYTFSLIQSSSITRRVLRCLLGFLALWGQKPCGGKYLYILSYSSITWRVLRCLLGFLALWGQKPCGGNNKLSKQECC